MSISEKVTKNIANKMPGQVFGYKDIPEYQQAPMAVSKAISRLVKSNKVKRIEKGRFYIPKKGVFGDLNPSDQELLKTLVYKEGRLKGYVTGVALYNQLGLTTQIPRTVKVAIEGAPQVKDFGSFRAKLVKSRAPIRQDDVLILQYLDVLRDIKEIPDADVNETLQRMANKLSQLDDVQLKRIQCLAVKYYNPACRAVLGLLLDFNKQNTELSLHMSLNPLSLFILEINSELWPGMSYWYLKSNLDSSFLSKQEEESRMDDLIEKYRQQIRVLAKENGVRNVRVFGSMARNEANELSDVDFLVELEEGQSGFALGGFLEDVADLLHRKIDVVTEKSLHPAIRDKVLREARTL